MKSTRIIGKTHKKKTKRITRLRVWNVMTNWNTESPGHQEKVTESTLEWIIQSEAKRFQTLQNFTLHQASKRLQTKAPKCRMNQNEQTTCKIIKRYKNKKIASVEKREDWYIESSEKSANCKPAEEVVEALCAAQCEAWQSHHLKLVIIGRHTTWSYEDSWLRN